MAAKDFFDTLEAGGRVEDRRDDELVPVRHRGRRQVARRHRRRGHRGDARVSGDADATIETHERDLREDRERRAEPDDRLHDRQAEDQGRHGRGHEAPEDLLVRSSSTEDRAAGDAVAFLRRGPRSPSRRRARAAASPSSSPRARRAARRPATTAPALRRAPGSPCRASGRRRVPDAAGGRRARARLRRRPAAGAGGGDGRLSRNGAAPDRGRAARGRRGERRVLDEERRRRLAGAQAPGGRRASAGTAGSSSRRPTSVSASAAARRSSASSRVAPCAISFAISGS